MFVMASPFLTPGSASKEGQLALLHLRRDLALPTVLSTSVASAAEAGYAEGVVTNTRFGSFPHSTLINLRWGSQVRASEVDTGSRGRKAFNQVAGKKRKAEEVEVEDFEVADSGQKDPVAASSGFIHILPPTPENWTTSLPHRTQVVYTPDYSYILHRIRARPGSVIIEAGSGSGSFTHAAARAVFNGYPAGNKTPNGQTAALLAQSSKTGKVFSYEFHNERYMKVTLEMQEHGLDSIVRTAHRDVYNDGFAPGPRQPGQYPSPNATAIFLDLPAPWKALPHLTRGATEHGPSVLDPSQPVHICTFSPCIEQVQKTVSALRQHGWLDIETVEMQQRRIEVKREYTGLEYEGMRGVNAVAANVEQALLKLREVEQKARDFHTGANTNENGPASQRLSRPSGPAQGASKILFDQGRLVHRSEPELKTHTSYLVFAILPREWTEDDESAARSEWKGALPKQGNTPKSQRQLKREARMKAQAKARGAMAGSDSMAVYENEEEE